MIAKRNYGIDLMRIISMFYVIVLHTLGQGGVLGAARGDSHQYMLTNFIMIWVFCAVDIFAIISGYVGYSDIDKKTKYSDYILLWLEVVFYGAGVTLFFNCMHPEIVTRQDFFKMFFPVTNDLYWYFTAYTGLFILMPLLNKAIRNFTKVFARKLLLLIFIIFSIYDVCFNKFDLGNGYSVMWLIILYVIGAIIKKCDIGKNISPRKAFLGIVILMVITWWILMINETISIFDTQLTGKTLISYVSPTILGAAMLYIIGAAKLKLPRFVISIIKFAAPSAFAAYILNNQMYIWSYGMAGRFTFLANIPYYMIPIEVFAFSAAFLLASILIDKIRRLIFTVLHFKELTVSIENMIRMVLGKFINENER